MCWIVVIDGENIQERREDCDIKNHYFYCEKGMVICHRIAVKLTEIIITHRVIFKDTNTGSLHGLTCFEDVMWSALRY